MREQKYSFYNKKETKEGKASVWLFAAAFVFLLAGIVPSCIKRGEGGPLAGGFTLVSALLAVYCFLTGLKGLRMREGGHITAVIGSILGGILAVVALTLFLAGLS